MAKRNRTATRPVGKSTRPPSTAPATESATWPPVPAPTPAPKLLWSNEADWPINPLNCVFLLEAVDMVGRKMFGARWKRPPFTWDLIFLPNVDRRDRARLPYLGA
jgi:hypothetical protein